MSSDIEIIKAGMETVMKPFVDLIQKLAGPAAEEIGLTFQDHFRVWRLKRQVRLFQRVKNILETAGVDPKPVPLKLLKPIIEEGSLEDDDSLQDRWAALLVNAAVREDGIHPSFSEILKQLSSLEVLALDVLERTTANEPKGGISKGVSAQSIVSDMALQLCGGDESAVESGLKAKIEKELAQGGCAENLSRLGIVTIVYPQEQLWLGMTAFGKRFISSCRPPRSGEVASEKP